MTGVGFKIGFELFTSCGPKIVEKIVGHDVRVFLDLKYHDIPHTVEKASEVATKMGVWMFNVHASGGSEMMNRSKETSQRVAYKLGIPEPMVIGVTVLTSIASLHELNISLSVEDQVLSLAQLAQNSGLDGVVCSANEACLIRQKSGPGFCLVTPGIRLPGDDEDDQKRTMSPQMALKQGSDYLVMGRSILGAKSPIKMIDAVLGMG